MTTGITVASNQSSYHSVDDLKVSCSTACCVKNKYLWGKYFIFIHIIYLVQNEMNTETRIIFSFAFLALRWMLRILYTHDTHIFPNSQDNTQTHPYSLLGKLAKYKKYPTTIEMPH